MCSVTVTTELNLVVVDLKHLLEPGANLLKSFLCLRSFPSRASPESNSVKALSDVDNHAHDLVVAFVFEGFSNGGQLSMQPEFVHID